MVTANYHGKGTVVTDEQLIAQQARRIAELE